MSSHLQRQLGEHDIWVSAIGLGGWAIGGTTTWAGRHPVSYGETDDAESIRAIQYAVEHGITFFDTADAYGAGRSERLLGQALGQVRNQVVVATKFGFLYDEDRRAMTGTIASKKLTAARIRQSCEASLRRLASDYIDLYQLHVDVAPEHAPVVIDALEGLVAAGLIRTYGCSVDEPAAAQAFTGGPHCAAIQFDLNVLQNNPAMLAVCESAGLAAICRTVLAEGLLTGKYGPESTFPPDDMRHRGLSWMIYFRGGRPDPHFLAQVHALREILTSNGRTLAQGALAWALARSPRAIPIPGFKSAQHVAEHAQALQLGPLTPAQMEQVDRVLARAQGQDG